jgi:hypothetical protein
MIGSKCVAGEPVSALLRALALTRSTDTEDGVFIEAEIPAPLAAPFMRALMRVEAELLLRAADRLTEASEEQDESDRRAEAFVLLVRRIAEASAD